MPPTFSCSTAGEHRHELVSGNDRQHPRSDTRRRPRTHLQNLRIVRAFVDQLCGQQLTFDLGDEQILEENGFVDGKRIGIGQMSYGVVVVPEIDTIRPSTFDKLKKFKSAGGLILRTGSAPKFIDGEKSAELDTFFAERKIRKPRRLGRRNREILASIRKARKEIGRFVATVDARPQPQRRLAPDYAGKPQPRRKARRRRENSRRILPRTGARRRRTGKNCRHRRRERGRHSRTSDFNRNCGRTVRPRFKGIAQSRRAQPKAVAEREISAGAQNASTTIQ